METIVSLITMVITWLFGFITKKKNIKTDLIPYQNLLIGILVGLIYWLIYKDFEMAIAMSGLLAGGIYDIIHNLKKMGWYQKYVKE